jgi:hypothetical protein
VGESAGVLERMRMRFEIEAGGGGPLDHLGEAGRQEWRAALAYEHER